MKKALCCVLSIIVILSAAFSTLAAVSDVEQGTYGGKNYTARISRDSQSVYAKLEYQVSAFLEFNGTIRCQNYLGINYNAQFSEDVTANYMEGDRTTIGLFGLLEAEDWSIKEFECDYKINHHLVTTLLV